MPEPAKATDVKQYKTLTYLGRPAALVAWKGGVRCEWPYCAIETFALAWLWVCWLDDADELRQCLVFKPFIRSLVYHTKEKES